MIAKIQIAAAIPNAWPILSAPFCVSQNNIIAQIKHINPAKIQQIVNTMQGDPKNAKNGVIIYIFHL